MKNSRSSRRSARPSTPQPRRDQVTLGDLLADAGITSWDYLIAGDGSGSGFKQEAGWSSISVERQTGERRIWFGAVNSGTVNFAEMMAYLQPLNWIASQYDDLRARAQEGARRRILRVHIFTDSKYCRDTGTMRHGATAARNAGLWAAIHAYERLGFVLHWHHVNRESVELNRLADRLSREARLALARRDLLARAEDQLGLTLDDCNPFST